MRGERRRGSLTADARARGRCTARSGRPGAHGPARAITTSVRTSSSGSTPWAAAVSCAETAAGCGNTRNAMPRPSRYSNTLAPTPAPPPGPARGCGDATPAPARPPGEAGQNPGRRSPNHRNPRGGDVEQEVRDHERPRATVSVRTARRTAAPSRGSRRSRPTPGRGGRTPRRSGARARSRRTPTTRSAASRVTRNASDDRSPPASAAPAAFMTTASHVHQ